MSELTIGLWMLPAYFLPAAVLCISIWDFWIYDTEEGIGFFVIAVVLFVLATLARVL